jgi:hypothetical protein
MRKWILMDPSTTASALLYDGPDARSMISQAKGSGLVGYNVQTAVDAKHHLIGAHEVTKFGNDRAHLSKMALAAREAMGRHNLKAFADRGYFNGPAAVSSVIPEALPRWSFCM